MTKLIDLSSLGAFLRECAPAETAPNTPQDQAENGPYSLAAEHWIELLAAVLGCSPAWLLETGRITLDDLAERGSIAATARLIQSYGWEAPPPSEPAPAPGPPTHQSAATWPPTWRAARDAYYSHIAGCPQCIAHRLKDPHHCPEGAPLRQRYDDESRRASEG